MSAAPALSPRLPALDLLRFLAAAMVLLFHYTYRGAVLLRYTTVDFPELDPFTRYGFFGIDLFFLISGFVILMTVDAGQGSPARFLASRIARLYPVFWVAATLVFLVMLGRPAPFGVPPGDYLANLSMAPAWFGAGYVDGVYWTLALEWRFYVGIVLYLLLLHRIRLDAVLAAWIALIAVYSVWPLASDWLRNLALGDFGAFFAAGCLFYRAWREGWTVWRGALLIVTWVCAMSGALRQIPLLPKATPDAIAQLPVIALNSAFFALFGLLALWQGFGRGGRVAVVLGTLTYPLYLVHQKIGYVLINLAQPVIGRWLAIAGTTLVALAIAWALHRGVERPYNARLRRWLERRLRWLDGAARTPRAQGADHPPAG